MDITYTFTICFLIGISHAAVKTFSPRPLNITALEGGVAYFRCTAVDYAATDVIQWRKQALLPGSVDESIVTINNGIMFVPSTLRQKYLVNGTVKFGNFDLVVRNVSERDLASYTCASGPISETAFLNALIKPRNLTIEYDQKRDRDVSLPFGREVEVTCHSGRSRPVAVLRWFKDGSEIISYIVNHYSSPDILGFGKVRSVLTHTFSEDYRGKRLKCVADLEYSLDVKSTSVAIDGACQAEGNGVFLAILSLAFLIDHV